MDIAQPSPEAKPRQIKALVQAGASGASEGLRTFIEHRRVRHAIIDVVMLSF